MPHFASRFLVLALAACAFAGLAEAQGFPQRTVTIVVPYAPGGGTDNVARTFAAALSNHWKQSVVVENHAGADGIIGTQRALRAPADGHTLILQLNTMLLWKATMPQNQGSDLLSELALISLIQTAPLGFAVNANFPGKDMKDFVAYCKTPGNSCSWGTATKYAQLIGKHLMDTLDLPQAVNVNYKGGGPMMNDLLGGHVTMTLPSVASAQTQRQAGKVKLLAVASRERFRLAADVPTLAESGWQVFADSWYGFMASKQTPPEILRAIAQAVQAVSKDPALLASIESSGGQAVFSSAEAFNDYVKREQAYLAPLLVKYPLQ